MAFFAPESHHVPPLLLVFVFMLQLDVSLAKDVLSQLTPTSEAELSQPHRENFAGSRRARVARRLLRKESKMQTAGLRPATRSLKKRAAQPTHKPVKPVDFGVLPGLLPIGSVSAEESMPEETSELEEGFRPLRTPDATARYNFLKSTMPDSTCWLGADDSPCRYNSNSSETVASSELVLNSSDPAFCRSCWFARQGAGPWLFIRDKGILGIGERMSHLVHGMAVAAKYNMTFGGAVIHPRQVACEWQSRGHGPQFNTWPSVCSLLQGVFKVSSAMDVLIKQLPSNVTVYSDVKQLDQAWNSNATRAKVFHPNSFVFLKQPWLGDLSGKQASFFTPEFLRSFQHIGVPLSVWPLKFRRNLPTVAVHLRRGDLRSNNSVGTGRYTDDSTTLALLKHITRRLGPADVHLWSSTERNIYHSEDFDIYRRKGVHVHLDGDIMEAWAHFARADIFVQGTSSFSYLPALANPRCVIFQRWWTLRPVTGWLDVTAWKSSFSAEVDNWNATWDARLDECFTRFGRQPRAMSENISLNKTNVGRM